MRPVLLKLGGSVLTDKAKPQSFRRAVARRLLTEVAKAGVPVVLLHGAGSFGHPAARKWRLGIDPVTVERRAGISETLAAVMKMHAEVLELAAEVGLKPIPVPLHLQVASAGGILEDLPVGRIRELLGEGYTPVLHGTLVRDDRLGWRIVSADELMAELAVELEPRLAVFATDVDGVLGGDPPGVLERLTDPAELGPVPAGAKGDDVTGGMQGKVRHGLAVAAVCPTLLLNGTVRGRLLDALKGKPVTGTRLGK